MDGWKPNTIGTTTELFHTTYGIKLRPSLYWFNLSLIKSKKRQISYHGDETRLRGLINLFLVASHGYLLTALWLFASTNSNSSS